MIALMNTEGFAVALEPDLIESVEVVDYPPDEPECLVRTSSGKEHHIMRSYAYVTGIIRKHYENH